MTKQVDLTLVLFETELRSIATAKQAGIVDFIADWECKGKEDRQCGYDTQINQNTLADLKTISCVTQVKSWCRLNAPGFLTKEEIDMAIAAGASVVLLPMVTSAKEVETFLRYVNGRCKAGILLETPQACCCAVEIAQYPLDVVYVGLNDLMIGLKNKSIFSALASGIVDEVRACFDVPLFGLGGVTVLDSGQPLPCRLFMQEMSRLRCTMTFLRRSYKRDIVSKDAVHELNRIRMYWKELCQRSPEQIFHDRQSFLAAVKDIEHSDSKGVSRIYGSQEPMAQ
ncbi:MAG: hypothetical protein HY209_00820 [Candidatus Omnitrophica bacterium]|nr:hypothetical protein [Candidatus Omnitrophota bacterium]